MKDKFNPWLPYNERIRDFIRWGELMWLVSSLVIGYLVLGWWGIVIAVILDRLNHLQGGPVVDAFDDYPYEERKKIPCSAGIENCCGNGYSHEFNVEYEKSLKWYEKII